MSSTVSFIDEVAATPGGRNIRACIQCGVCSGTCPAGDDMEYSPRRIIAMIRAGMKEEVLSSSAMWKCMSCYLCYDRCPRGVRPTEIAHALESLATKYGYKPRGTKNDKMYRSFVNSIKNNGRVHEVGMMMKYYLTTCPFSALKMLPVAVQLFLHKRMPVKPERVKGREDLAKITRKFQQIRG